VGRAGLRAPAAVVPAARPDASKLAHSGTIAGHRDVERLPQGGRTLHIKVYPAAAPVRPRGEPGHIGATRRPACGSPSAACFRSVAALRSAAPAEVEVVGEPPLRSADAFDAVFAIAGHDAGRDVGVYGTARPSRVTRTRGTHRAAPAWRWSPDAVSSRSRRTVRDRGLCRARSRRCRSNAITSLPVGSSRAAASMGSVSN